VGGIAAGICAPYLPERPGILAALAACLLLIAAALVLVGRHQTVGQRLSWIALAAGAMGGALVVARLALGVSLGPAGLPSAPPFDERAWQADVLTVGSTAGGMQRAMLAASDGSGTSWRVYAWLPRYPPFAPTDRIAFSARLEPAPQGEGFGEYLARSGAVATVRLRSLQSLPSAGPLAELEDLRRAGGDHLARALPAPQAGLAAGILIGLRDQVDRTVAAEFATSGLSHVVAISGWNIALVGAVMVALLRWLPRRQRTIIVLLAIGMYTMLAGASPSVMRAAVMGAICLLALESGRRGGAAGALGLAAWGMIVVDPAIVEDVGFRLSVAATAGLLAWGTPLAAWLGDRLPARVPGWLVESMGVSLAAQAATLPLVLLHFGRVSLVSPLANLVVAPIVAPVMLASLLGMIAGLLMALGLPALLMAPVVLGASLLLGAMIAVGSIAAALPLASLELAEPAGLVAAAATTLLLLSAGTIRGRAQWRRLTGRRRRSGAALRSSPTLAATHPRAGSTRRTGRRVTVVLAGAGMGLLLVAGSLASGRADGRLRITVLDVGQGDAVLVEGPRGARMLVDGGPDPDRLLALLDERIPAWDRRLDLAVLTHPHEDHAAGLALLLERYRVPVVAEPGMIGAGPGDQALRQVLSGSPIRRVLLAAGDTLALDGVAVRVLWPRPGEVPLRPPDEGRSINNVSVVLDIRYGQRRMLLTGDMEEDIDPQLLRDGLAGSGPIDVLKVAHHGSRSATTPELLGALRPRVALVSAGADNPYGHPAPATIERLESSGARVARTDRDGSLEVSTDGRDLRLATTGGRVAGPPSPRMEAALATVPAARQSSFVCAIPAPIPTLLSDATPRPPRGRSARRAPAERSLPLPDPWPGTALTSRWEPPCYDRSHGYPITSRGRRALGRSRSARLARGALLGRGGDRCLPGRPHRGPWHRRGPPHRGERSPPPRHGQDVAGRPSAQAAGSR
jgi:competence protein ComEC